MYCSASGVDEKKKCKQINPLVWFIIVKKTNPKLNPFFSLKIAYMHHYQYILHNLYSIVKMIQITFTKGKLQLGGWLFF